MEGTQWRELNVVAEHNRGLVALQNHPSEWSYDPTLASLTPISANNQTKCCPHPNCTTNGAWCQSTAYSSIAPVGPRGSDGSSDKGGAHKTSLDLGGEFVIVYDRLANGWGGPPGQWGQLDRVFSMRFRLGSEGQ